MPTEPYSKPSAAWSSRRRELAAEIADAGHGAAARRHSASPEAIVEAIRVASEMRAEAAFAHSRIAVPLFEDPATENGL
jgi:hypothetical protein